MLASHNLTVLQVLIRQSSTFDPEGPSVRELLTLGTDSVMFEQEQHTKSSSSSLITALGSFSEQDLGWENRNVIWESYLRAWSRKEPLKYEL